MQLPYQFQGQTVKGQGWRQSGAYRVSRTLRPHYLFILVSDLVQYTKLADH